MEINLKDAIKYYIANFLKLSEENENEALLALSKMSESILAVLSVTLGYLKPSSTRVDSQDRKIERCMLQYMAGKQLAIHNLVTIKHFVSINGKKQEIKDNTPAISIVRSMYEMVLTYHSIFISSKTQEERDFLLNIWIYKGLTFPATKIISDIPIVKTAKQERKRKLQEIKKCALYRIADKQQIFKNSLTYFSGVENDRHLEYCSFQEGWKLIRELGAFNGTFVESLYARLCSETHPTYYGLIMYENQDSIKPSPSLLSLYVSCALLCIMLGEIIIIREKNLEDVFKLLDEMQQQIFSTFIGVL